MKQVTQNFHPHCLQMHTNVQELLDIISKLSAYNVNIILQLITYNICKSINETEYELSRGSVMKPDRVF